MNETQEKLEWSMLEYEERERSSDWFWALGVIVVTSTLASIIYENYFFAGLLIIAGGLLWHFAERPPETTYYEINNKGLRINNTLYPYENIKAFFVQVDREGDTGLRPTLFIHSERFFIPVFSVPIEYDDAEYIRAIMLDQNIPEVEMKEHPSEMIMEILGF